MLPHVYLKWQLHELQHGGATYCNVAWIRSYSYPVDTSTDSHHTHQPVITASLVSSCLYVASLQIRTHIDEVTLSK